ncbi:ABC transporter permease, partial [Streptomyces sp. SID10244]|nr:ABC transporter permease [Streptomyces sp. SID10244]
MAGGVTISKSRPEYYLYEARKQLRKPLKLLDGAGEQ